MEISEKPPKVSGKVPEKCQQQEVKVEPVDDDPEADQDDVAPSPAENGHTIDSSPANNSPTDTEEMDTGQEGQPEGGQSAIAGDHCLICGSNIQQVQEDFDLGKYEQFLSEALHVPSRIPDATEDDPGQIFCGECQKNVSNLFQLHVNMKEAVRIFEEERDKVALDIVATFLTKSKPIDDFPVEMHKDSVAKRWKKIYTGEARKEKEIVKLVKEREHRVASRAKRFQKLRGSFKARSQVEKAAKRIQQKMTSIYFTPKPQMIRKRKQIFLRVTLPSTEPAQQLSCPICDKVFKHEYSLTIHLRSHAVESGKLYKCSICDKVCSTRQQLMAHRKEDHSETEKLIRCDAADCSETFTSRAAFKQHVKTHVETKSFVCDICSKEFPSSYYLKKHMVSHENVDFSVTDLFSCKTCSKTFLRSQDLSEHLKIHDSGSTLFGCEFCGKGFKEEEGLKSHMTIHQGANPYICDECGQRFASEALLVSHLKVHRPKGHVCQECGKACRSRDGLRKHQLIHTGKKPFSCHICNIGFIERKSFDAHMVKHTGKLPYKCSDCKNSDEGFKDAKDLRRHKFLKHPEFIPSDRKYACDFCWNGFSTQEIMEEHKKKIHERYKCQHCNRVFKLGDHLRRHMYIHTGEKPYKCSLCEKSFNQESNLKEHMYRHTGIRPHRCPHCPGVGYLRRMHLKEHMMKEHGTDKVPSLPMGRAAQNARRTGRHPVPTPVIKSEALTLEGYGGDQSEILVSSSNPSNCIILLQSKGTAY